MAHYFFTGQPLVPVNRDEDLAGPEAILRAATWTERSMRDHLNKQRTVVQDDEAFDLLVQLLRVNPTDRFATMGDVLCHPFFFSSAPSGTRVGHATATATASKATKFVELAKAMKVVPLGEDESVFKLRWRFNRMDLALTGSGDTSLQSREQVEVEGAALLALTGEVLGRSIRTAVHLPLGDRQALSEEVAKEVQRYDEVQNTILTNLVIQLEEERARAFDAVFPPFRSAVEAAHPTKPNQRVASVARLYFEAAAVKARFDKVRGVWRSSPGMFECSSSINFLYVCHDLSSTSVQ